MEIEEALTVRVVQATALSQPRECTFKLCILESSLASPSSIPEQEKGLKETNTCKVVLERPVSFVHQVFPFILISS